MTEPVQPEDQRPPDQHSSAGQIPAAEFGRVQASPEFARLRKVFRSFAFPMTVVFLVWYFAFILLSTLAPGFMAIKVAGLFNVGILFGLLQFVSTFLITWLYFRHMNKNVDPIATSLREDLEGSIR